MPVLSFAPFCPVVLRASPDPISTGLGWLTRVKVWVKVRVKRQNGIKIAREKKNPSEVRV